MAGPYIPLFASTQAHMSPLELGIFMTLLAMSGILISVLLGRWSDRMPSRKPVVLLASGRRHRVSAAVSDTLVFPAAADRVRVSGHGGGLVSTALRARQIAAPGSRSAGVGTRDHHTQIGVLARLGGGAGAGGAAGGPGALHHAVSDHRWPVRRDGPDGAVGAHPPAASVSRSVRPLAVSGPPIPLWKIVSSFVLYGTSLSMGALALPLYVTHVLHGSTDRWAFCWGCARCWKFRSC